MTTHVCYVGVKYDDGTHETIVIPCTHTAGDRTNEEFFAPRNFSKPGVIGWATFELPNSPVTRRGQIYAMAQVVIGKTHPAFMTGYPTTPNHLGLGQFEDSLSGRGHLSWREIVADVTPVDVTEALAATNAYRIVRGYVWYYHASGDAANRTLNVQLQNVGGDLPTGMTTGLKTTPWLQAQMTLTANQEATLYSRADEGKDGLTATVDDGSLSTVSTSSGPAPWPMKVGADDNAQLMFDVGSAHTNDRHSIYILQEEWIEE